MGVAIGALNAFCIVQLKVVPMIATMGTWMAFKGAGLMIINSSTLSNFPASFKAIVQDWNLFGVSTLIVVMLIVAVVAALLLKYVSFFHQAYFIGSNPESARLSGINVDNWKVAVYTLSGFFIGMCALFYAAAYTTITPGTGAGQEMNGITGVIIGGTSMSGGSGTMVGTLIGVFIMSVLKTGLANCGLQAPWQTFLTGAVVIGAVLLDIARTKAANRVKKG